MNFHFSQVHASNDRAASQRALMVNYSRCIAFTTIGVLASGCARAAQNTAPKATQAAPTTLALGTSSGTPLGGGLNGQIDWVGDETFVDMVKTTRGFQSLANGNPIAKGGADGWSTEDFMTILSDNKSAVAPGNYHISFRGPKNVEVSLAQGTTQILNRTYDAATQTTNCDLVVPAGVTFLRIDFKKTQGQVKNLRVLRPGYSADKPPVFTTEFLNFLKARNPTVLRFMDWRSTNGNLEEKWSERALPTDATQTQSLKRAVKVGWSTTPYPYDNGKGVCWEYCIALSNTLNKDMWINVPNRVDDNYVRQLATLIKTQLKPNLNVWIEYSNEVWNDGFLQTGTNRDAAVEEVAANPKSNLAYDGDKGSVTVGDRRFARRLKEISDIFGQVFGANAVNTRLRPVLAGQLAPSRFDNMLTFINSVYGAPNKYFYAIAVAPYFGCGNGQGADARKDLTKDDVLNELQKSVDDYKNGTVLNDVAMLATQYSLKMTAYEGGPDTFGPNNIQAKRAASLDPRMQKIVVDYLDMWYSKGGDQFNWFTLGANTFDTQYGTWSIVDNIRDINQPKALGFDQVRRGARPPITVGAPVPGEIDARARFGETPPYNSTTLIRFIGKGSRFEYLIRAAKSGIYQLRISGATTSTGTAKPVAVYLNNALVQNAQIPATANDTTLADSPPVALKLNAGLNAIRLLVPDERSVNLNSLKLTLGDTKLANTLPTTDFYAYGGDATSSAPYTNLFNVSDAETPASDIAVSATSDNTKVVPNANIVLEKGDFAQWGNKYNRKMTITPVAGQSGKANILVTIKDGNGLSRTLTFDLNAK